MNLRESNGWVWTSNSLCTVQEKTNQTVDDSCSFRCLELITWAMNHRVGYELKLQICGPGNNNVFSPGPGWWRGIPNLSRLGSTPAKTDPSSNNGLFVPGFQCTWCWAGGGGGSGGGGVLASSPEHIIQTAATAEALRARSAPGKKNGKLLRSSCSCIDIAACLFQAAS